MLCAEEREVRVRRHYPRQPKTNEFLRGKVILHLKEMQGIINSLSQPVNQRDVLTVLGVEPDNPIHSRKVQRQLRTLMQIERKRRVYMRILNDRNALDATIIEAADQMRQALKTLISCLGEFNHGVVCRCWDCRDYFAKIEMVEAIIPWRYPGNYQGVCILCGTPVSRPAPFC